MDLDEIMKQKNFVVVGNTLNPDKYAYKIKKALLEHDYQVKCVGKELISINAIDGDIDIIDLCINPIKGLEYIKECKKTFKCIVIQPGAGDDELIQYLKDNNIPYIEGCVLVGLSLYGKNNINPIKLRPYNRMDGEYIANWITDEKMFYQWSADRINKYPLTAGILNEYYDSQSANTKHFVVTAINESGIPIGHIMMRFLDNTYKNLRFGFVIVDNNARGKGYGKKMLETAFDYAFNILKVERVTLGVFANNEAAIKCYESVGLVEMAEHSRIIYEINGEQWECIELEKYAPHIN